MGDGSINVILPMTFLGDNSAENIRIISASIESKWTGNIDGRNIRTTVVPEVLAGVENFTIITNGPATGGNGDGHSYVQGGNTAHISMLDIKSRGIAQPDGSVTVSSKGDATPAHEGGHLMGVPDSKQTGAGLMDSGGGKNPTGQDVDKLLAEPQPGRARNSLNYCTPSGCD